MYLINNNFINNLEDLLVEESEEQMEEIILTLNYGGLFGINNINNYLQNKKLSLITISGANRPGHDSVGGLRLKKKKKGE
ncbi:hypothetical protein [Mesomycoplasma hyorhinis]|uniref:hypothetical protein n=1 Tax=Mesomycoplasma hyorhinis TaxID=2100 RepID=UPI001C04766B|nr:hypothetical protein [Mesomycoplasma hyorhinis]